MLSRKTKSCPLLLVLAATAWLTPAPKARAQVGDTTKPLKAAFTYKFAKFVEWPEGSPKKGASFVIGVLGDDAFGQILEDTVKNQKIAGRTIKIRRLHWSRDKDRTELKNCQTLFISRSEQANIKGILAALKGQPVLLVSDIPGFARKGGMIGLVLNPQTKKIEFEINRAALGQAKLKAKAYLLKLARIVQPKESSPREDRTRKSKP